MYSHPSHNQLNTFKCVLKEENMVGEKVSVGDLWGWFWKKNCLPW